MPQYYILIIGYGRSGSTALDQELSSYRDILGMGEVRYLAKENRLARRCACGELYRNCSIWSLFFRSKGNISKNLTTFSFYSSFTETISKLSDIKGYRAVVDSSKSTLASVPWLLILLIFFRKKIYFVHIKRNWEEVKLSVSKGTNEHLQFGHKNKIFRVSRAYFMYHFSNYLASFLRFFGGGSFVKFDDFIENPKSIADSVLSQIDPSLLENIIKNESTKNNWHQIAGNRMKMRRSLQ